MGWYIVGAIVGLAIDILICIYFADIAEEKGHSKIKYFFICFFLGILGCARVAALPDMVLYTKVADLEGKLKKTSDNQAGANAEKWLCGNCGAENSNNYGQCKKCGTYRG